jgi:hypothetical protein
MRLSTLALISKCRMPSSHQQPSAEILPHSGGICKMRFSSQLQLSKDSSLTKTFKKQRMVSNPQNSRTISLRDDEGMDIPLRAKFIFAAVSVLKECGTIVVRKTGRGTDRAG